MPRIFWNWLLIFAGLTAGIRAQTAPEPLGTVEGRVVNEATGAGIGRAQVRWMGRGEKAEQGVVETDEGGRFTVTMEAPGAVFMAAKRGYLLTGQGRMAILAPRGKQSARPELVLRLTPFSVVAGRVTDFYGEGVQGLTVEALEARVNEGARTMRRHSTAETDDRGRFRLWNLPPGPYYLRVLGRSQYTAGVGEIPEQRASAESYAPVFYPAAGTQGEAEVLRIGGGETRTVEFKLLAGQGYAVRGRLEGLPAGAQPGVVLLRNGEEMGGVVRVDVASGGFEIQDVPAGHYELQGWVTVGEQMKMGRRGVTVTNRAVAGVVVPLEEPGQMEVRVRGEGGVELRLEPVDEAGRADRRVRPVVHARKGEQGWVVRNLYAGWYRCVAKAEGEGSVSGVRQGSRDVLKDGLLVRAGANEGLLVERAPGEGRVEVTVKRLPGTEYGARVLLLRGEGLGQQVRVENGLRMGPPPDGAAEVEMTVAFGNLAGGEYQLLVVSEEEAEYRNAAALAALTGRMKRVTVREGETARVEVEWVKGERQ